MRFLINHLPSIISFPRSSTSLTPFASLLASASPESGGQPTSITRTMDSTATACFLSRDRISRSFITSHFTLFISIPPDKLPLLLIPHLGHEIPHSKNWITESLPSASPTFDGHPTAINSRLQSKPCRLLQSKKLRPPAIKAAAVDSKSKPPTANEATASACNQSLAGQPSTSSATSDLSYRLWLGVLLTPAISSGNFLSFPIGDIFPYLCIQLLLRILFRHRILITEFRGTYR